nr:molybdopterin oxidoreductase family protein [Pseudomonadales bacterium]
KAETAFFNFEFPDNHFHVRKPLFEPPAGVLTEAEIHYRLTEAMGAIPSDVIDQLNSALDESRTAYQAKVFELIAAEPALMGVAPALLHRTLGERLPADMRNAVGLWAPAMEFALTNPEQLQNAGISDSGEGLGWALFDKMISSPSGFTFSSEDWQACWDRIKDGGIWLENPELIEEITVLKQGAPSETTDEFPFLLSAGERRAYTANTIVRDPEWRRKDAQGALHIHPEDAARLNLGTGSAATLVTQVGEATVEVEVSNRMMRGHVAIPNGLGLYYPDDDGNTVLTGVAPNELTSLALRDKFAGTPWHKSVPVRIEAGQEPGFSGTRFTAYPQN